MTAIVSVVEEVVPGRVAVMVAEPVATRRTTPVGETLATFGFEDDQITPRVYSRVLTVALTKPRPPAAPVRPVPVTSRTGAAVETTV